MLFFRALGMRLEVLPMGDNKHEIGGIDHTGIVTPLAYYADAILSFT